MIDLNKPYKELVELRKQSVPGGDVYEQLTQEINRIQQDTNNVQIAKLIEETKILKGITERNATTSENYPRKANWLAIIAIVIALIALFKK